MTWDCCAIKANVGHGAAGPGHRRIEARADTSLLENCKHRIGDKYVFQKGLLFMNMTNQTRVSPAITPLRRFGSGSYLFSFAPALLFFAFVWPFSGSKDVQMMAGQSNPAARGTIHLHVGDNGNTELDLKADSLASPSALTPSKNAYVVWIQSPDEAPQNHGQITIDKNQKAELKTVTPYKRFRVFITAEDQPQMQAPEGPTVLSADVAEGK
jgi:hypothetical protein